MTKRQEAKLGMYEAILALCTQNGVIVALILAFSNAVAELADIVKEIKKVAQVQTKKGSGSENKKTDQDTLCDLIKSMADAVYAYATKIGDGVLRQSVKYSLSELKNLKDEQLPTTSKEIYDIAKPLAAELADFGVVTQDFTDIENALTSYGNTVTDPSTVIGHKKTATSNLSDLYKAADTVLKTIMDKTIGKFKKNNPDFFKDYKNLRAIKDAPTKHKPKPGETPVNPS